MTIINDPEIVSEVTAALEAYEAALMANEVSVMDGLFWSSPHTVRYGPTESLYGQEEILAFRRARSGGAPPRRVRRTVVTTFGRDYATANIEFQREGSERIGRQSQVWVRLDEGWRVVAAHVSMMDEAG